MLTRFRGIGKRRLGVGLKIGITVGKFYISISCSEVSNHSRLICLNYFY